LLGWAGRAGLWDGEGPARREMKGRLGAATRVRATGGAAALESKRRRVAQPEEDGLSAASSPSSGTGSESGALTQQHLMVQHQQGQQVQQQQLLQQLQQQQLQLHLQQQLQLQNQQAHQLEEQQQEQRYHSPEEIERAEQHLRSALERADPERCSAALEILTNLAAAFAVAEAEAGKARQLCLNVDACDSGVGADQASAAVSSAGSRSLATTASASSRLYLDSNSGLPASAFASAAGSPAAAVIKFEEYATGPGATARLQAHLQPSLQQHLQLHLQLQQQGELHQDQNQNQSHNLQQPKQQEEDEQQQQAKLRAEIHSRLKQKQQPTRRPRRPVEDGSASGRWTSDELLLVLHIAETYFYGELKTIGAVCRYCGLNRPIRAIDKQLKRLLMYKKWTARNHGLVLQTIRELKLCGFYGDELPAAAAARLVEAANVWSVPGPEELAQKQASSAHASQGLSAKDLAGTTAMAAAAAVTGSLEAASDEDGDEDEDDESGPIPVQRVHSSSEPAR
jgi:hypothetical protein